MKKIFDRKPSGYFLQEIGINSNLVCEDCGKWTICTSFLYFRIFQKLPITRQIYFAATQGRNGIISGAEVLGRLQFCGFDIIAEQERDYNLYFIARKTKEPHSHYEWRPSDKSQF